MRARRPTRYAARSLRTRHQKLCRVARCGKLRTRVGWGVRCGGDWVSCVCRWQHERALNARRGVGPCLRGSRAERRRECSSMSCAVRASPEGRPRTCLTNSSFGDEDELVTKAHTILVQYRWVCGFFCRGSRVLTMFLLFKRSFILCLRCLHSLSPMSSTARRALSFRPV